MLIIAGTISLDPAQLDDALALTLPLCEKVRAEEGCHDYVFTPNPAVPGEVRLFEIWETEEDLAVHFTTPHMAEWQEQIGSFTITGRSIMRYDVSGSKPL